MARKDRLSNVGLEDEGDEAEPASTGTGESVDVVDSLEQLGPRNARAQPDISLVREALGNRPRVTRIRGCRSPPRVSWLTLGPGLARRRAGVRPNRCGGANSGHDVPAPGGVGSKHTVETDPAAEIGPKFLIHVPRQTTTMESAGFVEEGLEVVGDDAIQHRFLGAELGVTVRVARWADADHICAWRAACLPRLGAVFRAHGRAAIGERHGGRQASTADGRIRKSEPHAEPRRLVP